MRVLGGENCLRSTNPVNIYKVSKLKKSPPTTTFTIFKRKCTWALGSLRGVGSSAHYPGMIAVKYIKIIIIDNIFHKYIKYGYSSTYYV